MCGASGTGEVSIRDVLPLDARQRATLARIVREEPEAAALFRAKRDAAERLLVQTPRPLEVIHYEGLVGTDERRLKTIAHLQDIDDAAALFELWQVTAEPAHGAKVREVVLAWAQTYRPTGNDVNEDKLMPLFLAHEALRETFAPAERGVVDRWLIEIAEKNAAAGKREQDRGRSNRHAKRLRIVAAIALSQNRTDWLEETGAAVREFVSTGLYADGSSYDFHHRDTLTYHASALVPLLDLAVIARRRGEELYAWESPSGSSLRKSVEFVRPYAEGTKTREEWVNSKVELDRKRAAAGLSQYQPGRRYDPRRALPLLEAAELFQPDLTPLVAQLAGSSARRFPTWRTVVNAAAR